MMLQDIFKKEKGRILPIVQIVLIIFNYEGFFADYLKTLSILLLSSLEPQ